MLPDLSGFDLAKHGLSGLDLKPSHLWTDDEMDRFLDALRLECADPVLGMRYTKKVAQALLDLSQCRRCGRCCDADPDHPENNGVIVQEEELKTIAKHTGIGYSVLIKNTYREKKPGNRSIRYLKQPCPFLSPQGCKIYRSRPTVCCSFPITNVVDDGKTLVKISVRCDYGRDIYKTVLRMTHDSAPPI
ncbi:YkgJ family cysteine cluster protein [Dehalogenimonas sp. THU2]|uniref:YkgJ family cysteine cluster protein n=1 Tax=Dehalogenimonas sp. THU2 TaxID=3151121 RepID=UPI0032185122